MMLRVADMGGALQLAYVPEPRLHENIALAALPWVSLSTKLSSTMSYVHGPSSPTRLEQVYARACFRFG